MKVALVVEPIFVGKFKCGNNGPDDELEDNRDCQKKYLTVLVVQRVRYDAMKKNTFLR